MARRFIKDYGDLKKNLVTERVHGTKHVEHYRHLHQDMDPVIEHVRHTAQKVNEAPTSGNRNQHHYIGSIPQSILIDWLQKHGYTFDAYARNDDGRNGLGIADEFKAWFLRNPDMKKFRADTHVHRIKRVYA